MSIPAGTSLARPSPRCPSAPSPHGLRASTAAAAAVAVAADRAGHPRRRRHHHRRRRRDGLRPLPAVLRRGGGVIPGATAPSGVPKQGFVMDERSVFGQTGGSGGSGGGVGEPGRSAAAASVAGGGGGVLDRSTGDNTPVIVQLPARWSPRPLGCAPSRPTGYRRVAAYASCGHPVPHTVSLGSLPTRRTSPGLSGLSQPSANIRVVSVPLICGECGRKPGSASETSGHRSRTHTGSVIDRANDRPPTRPGTDT